MRQAPEPPPDFAFATPTSILKTTQRTLEQSERLHTEIAATIPIEFASFENIIRPLVDDANRASCTLRKVGGLLSAVSPDVAVRNASREAEKLISTAQDAALMRHDVAMLVDAAYAREKQQHARGCSQLDREDRHVLQWLHGRYTRAGSTIQNEEKVEHLQRLRAELKEVCVSAVQTMSDANDGIHFSLDELSGLSSASLAELQSNRSIDGQDSTWISFRASSTILRDATSSSTRKKYEVARDRRFPENVHRLQRAVVLRDEIARLLGFDNHAELKSQEMMSASAQDTILVLKEMERRLRPLRDYEINEMLRLKQREGCEHEENDDPSILYAWDWAFYAKQIRQANYMLDRSKLAEYFEVNHTLAQMLLLFEKLFGMKFCAVEASVWHDSVGAYQVWNSPSQGGDFLGWLYTDVFDREGKYQNALHFMIKPGFVEADGTRHYPVSALICNFDPPSASQPSLLAHSEVTLMFHELGHAIHNLVARTKYAVPHSRDYTEIPSLMLEHWTWNADVLVAIGKHYTCLDQRPAEAKEDTHVIEDMGALPRDLAEKAASTKQLHQAHQMAILIQRALFDLTIHSPNSHQEAENLDITRLWNSTRSKIVGLALSDKPGEESLAHAAFGHLFRKYDAGFFAYAMSKAWSEDLYKHGFAGCPLDEAAARRYRRLVLEPGSSIPEREILEKFLGRKLSLDAYYATLSGTVDH